MAVLVEAISVVIKRDRIQAQFPGGWDSFIAFVPNQTLCADGYIARVGFMVPADVEAFVNALEGHGFVYLQDDHAEDLCVVDQQHGPTMPCTWLEFGQVPYGRVPGEHVALARWKGDTEMQFAAPSDWSYDNSLSKHFGFVPTGERAEGLRFLRHEDGLDVYFNDQTGKEVFVARTLSRDA